MISTKLSKKGLQNPIKIARDLIRCPSVTPADAGAIGVLTQALEELGFVCNRLEFSEPNAEPVINLYARLGTTAPNFCFAGHTDVVPTGEGWKNDPFAAEEIEGYIIGRGAVDMKGAIAAFVAATAQYLDTQNNMRGSISLLITGDEEGLAINGTTKVLKWLKEKNEIIHGCLVGEPTNPLKLGDMIKIGRRGSLNAILTVKGIQGHAAYPHLASNPVLGITKLLSALTTVTLDTGNKRFQPSTLTLTSIDVGNDTTNIIPPQAKARFNIRFNDEHTGEGLTQLLYQILDKVNIEGSYKLEVIISGESFISPEGALSKIIANAVKEVTGRTPELSTSGGTSDARFIKSHCPVYEFGLTSKTMHKVNEKVAVSDLYDLTQIYRTILSQYLSE
jgi:succinyl-diaminopimelate desuccinylase